ncbi:MAG: hypothetical protein ACFNM7_07785, partial [Prevotella conceptionensis]
MNILKKQKEVAADKALTRFKNEQLKNESLSKVNAQKGKLFGGSHYYSTIMDDARTQYAVNPKFQNAAKHKAVDLSDPGWMFKKGSG